jgi:putative transposase
MFKDLALPSNYVFNKRSSICYNKHNNKEVTAMQLVEQHVIDRNDPRYPIIDAAAFASKNLYNAALYEMRQAYIHERKYLNYNQMDKLMKRHEAYKALPAKVAQQVLMQLANDWENFFKARAAYKENPSKFLGRPRLPKYKDKAAGY